MMSLVLQRDRPILALLDALAVFQFGSDQGYSGHFLEIDDLLILTLK
jgi:hypothetical protein